MCRMSTESVRKVNKQSDRQTAGLRCTFLFDHFGQNEGATEATGVNASQRGSSGRRILYFLFPRCGCQHEILHNWGSCSFVHVYVSAYSRYIHTHIHIHMPASVRQRGFAHVDSRCAHSGQTTEHVDKTTDKQVVKSRIKWSNLG